MKDDSRALSLNIEASTPEDFNELLRQALYEIRKLLPLPPDAPVGERNNRVVSAFLEDSQVSVGRTEGTLGRYAFEFLRGSREYAELERALLKQGYTRQRNSDFLGDAEFVYEHQDLGKKVIAGAPLAVQTYEPKADPKW